VTTSSLEIPVVTLLRSRHLQLGKGKGCSVKNVSLAILVKIYPYLAFKIAWLAHAQLHLARA